MQNATAELRVRVDIRDTRIGGLWVDLITPEVTTVGLRKDAGSSSDNPVWTYSALRVPALRALVGHPIRSPCTLKWGTTSSGQRDAKSLRITARLETAALASLVRQVRATSPQRAGTVA